MDRDTVIGKVIDAVEHVQKSSGRAAAGVGSETRPFRDIEGFDSLCGIAATVLLSNSLGIELPDSVFVAEDGSSSLSVAEIAENVSEYVTRRKVLS